MTKNAFLNAAKKLQETKNMDELLVGSKQAYLEDGKHNLTITSIDTTTVDRNYIDVVVANQQGRELRERLYLTDKDGELDYRFRLMMSALFGNKEVYTDAFEKFIDQAVVNQQVALEMLTGMKFVGEVGKKNGATINKISGQTSYLIFDVATGEQHVQFPDAFESIDDAKTALETAGVRRAFSKIIRWEQQDESVVKQNYAALCSAIEGRAKAKVANSNSGATIATGIKKAPSLI